jgi:hypothetical protein
MNILNFFKQKKWTDENVVDVISKLEECHKLGYTVSKSLNLIAQDKDVGRTVNAIRKKLNKYNDLYFTKELNNKNLLWGSYFKEKELAAIKEKEKILAKTKELLRIKTELKAVEIVKIKKAVKVKKVEIVVVEPKLDVVVNEVIKTKSDVITIENKVSEAVKKWTNEEVLALANLLNEKRLEGHSVGKSLSIIYNENKTDTVRTPDAMRKKLNKYGDVYLVTGVNSKRLSWGTYFQDSVVEKPMLGVDDKKNTDAQILGLKTEIEVSKSIEIQSKNAEITESIKTPVLNTEVKETPDFKMGVQEEIKNNFNNNTSNPLVSTTWDHEKLVNLADIAVGVFKSENIKKDDIFPEDVFLLITLKLNTLYGTNFENKVIIRKLRKPLGLSFTKCKNEKKYKNDGNYQNKDEINRNYRKQSKIKPYILTEGCESIDTRLDNSFFRASALTKSLYSRFSMPFGYCPVDAPTSYGKTRAAIRSMALHVLVNEVNRKRDMDGNFDIELKKIIYFVTGNKVNLDEPYKDLQKLLADEDFYKELNIVDQSKFNNLHLRTVRAYSKEDVVKTLINDYTKEERDLFLNDLADKCKKKSALNLSVNLVKNLFKGLEKLEKKINNTEDDLVDDDDYEKTYAHMIKVLDKVFCERRDKMQLSVKDFSNKRNVSLFYLFYTQNLIDDGLVDVVFLTTSKGFYNLKSTSKKNNKPIFKRKEQIFIFDEVDRAINEFLNYYCEKGFESDVIDIITSFYNWSSVDYDSKFEYLREARKSINAHLKDKFKSLKLHKPIRVVFDSDKVKETHLLIGFNGEISKKNELHISYDCDSNAHYNILKLTQGKKKNKNPTLDELMEDKEEESTNKSGFIFLNFLEQCQRHIEQIITKAASKYGNELKMDNYADFENSLYAELHINSPSMMGYISRFMIKRLNYAKIEGQSIEELQFKNYMENTKILKIETKSDENCSERYIGLRSYEVETNPNLMFLKMAENNVVIGTSATSTSQSVTSNFHNAFFELKLAENYNPLNDKEVDDIYNEYQKNNKYDEFNIHADYIKPVDLNLLLKKFQVPVKTIQRLINGIEEISPSSNLGKNHEIERITKRLVAVSKFLENPESQFSLFLLQKMKYTKSIKDAIKNIIEVYMCKFYKVNPESFDFISLTSTEFKNKKIHDKICAEVQIDTKRLIFAAQQSMGVGVNISPKIAKNNINSYIKKNDYGDKINADVDFLYCESPSHVLNILFNESDTKEVKDRKRILSSYFHISALEAACELSIRQAEILLNAILSVDNPYYVDASMRQNLRQSIFKSYHLERTEDVTHTYTSLLKQHIGRIPRGSYKKKNTYIYLDCELKDKVVNKINLKKYNTEEFYQTINQLQVKSEVDNNESRKVNNSYLSTNAKMEKTGYKFVNSINNLQRQIKNGGFSNEVNEKYENSLQGEIGKYEEFKTNICSIVGRKTLATLNADGDSYTFSYSREIAGVKKDLVFNEGGLSVSYKNLNSDTMAKMFSDNVNIMNLPEVRKDDDFDETFIPLPYAMDIIKGERGELFAKTLITDSFVGSSIHRLDDIVFENADFIAEINDTRFAVDAKHRNYTTMKIEEISMQEKYEKRLYEKKDAINLPYIILNIFGSELVIEEKENNIILISGVINPETDSYNDTYGFNDFIQRITDEK